MEWLSFILTKMMRIILLSLNLLLLSSCLVKNKSHSEYWEHNFNNLQALADKYSDSELYPILFGTLTPKDENLLYQKENTLYLNASVKRINNSLIAEIHDKEQAEEEEYFTNIEYSKSTFKNKPTYKIKKKTFQKYPYYSVKDFLFWLDTLSQASNSEEQLSILNSSLVYKFICSEFRCANDRDELNSTLTFALDSRMSNNYKSFYNRISDILSKLRFKTKISNKQGKLLEIFSEGKIIYFKFFNLKKNDIASSTQLLFQNDFEINFYGIKINIQNLDYLVQFKFSNEEENLRGNFINYPKHKVSGNFLYFLPTNVIDLFIPGDIDTYIADYIELMIRPTDSKGANFNSKFKKVDKQVHLFFESYSETFQKSFRPLSNNRKEKKEGKDFIQDLRTKIIEDLLPTSDK